MLPKFWKLIKAEISVTLWGLISITFARLIQSPLINFLVIGIASTNLIMIIYLFIIWQWWLPLTSTVFMLTLNSLGMTAIYKHYQAVRLKIKARHEVERTFETIHNGPLQTLAQALKLIRERNLPPDKLLPKLEKKLEQLNRELRGIYEFLQREPLNQDTSLYLGSGIVINLQDPIHEVLYQVYSYTLERDFPYFKMLKVKIRTFEPVEERYLNLEQKRGLCRFLEEALCNVGKHAIGATKLEVSFTENKGWYTLSIIDNGLGINSFKEGRGTQQFKNLARQLKGKFRRSTLSSRGTLCELSLPMAKFSFCSTKWHC
jgi:hypothetical protein